ncbi:hypothetical protein Salat_0207300, partial [Sesamum alatum]
VLLIPHSKSRRRRLPLLGRPQNFWLPLRPHAAHRRAVLTSLHLFLSSSRRTLASRRRCCSSTSSAVMPRPLLPPPARPVPAVDIPTTWRRPSVRATVTLAPIDHRPPPSLLLSLLSSFFSLFFLYPV